jgi:hypothetical protein
MPDSLTAKRPAWMEPYADSLDFLLAEKVMGWTLLLCEEQGGAQNWYWSSPYRQEMSLASWHPSGDVNGALQVVDHLQGKGWQVRLHSLASGGWEALFHRNSGQSDVRECAGTLPLALCRAALRTADA